MRCIPPEIAALRRCPDTDLLSSCRLFPSKQGLQVRTETFERCKAFWGGFKDFLLVDEDFPSSTFHQRSKTFPHAPAGIPQDLKTLWSWDQERYAAVAQNADGFGKTLECLELEAGEVETLELFFGKHC